MYISLKDNQYKPTEWKAAVKKESGKASPQGFEEIKTVLEQFSGKTLAELVSNEKKYGKFLVFPSDAAESDLDTKDKVLFELLEENTENPKF